MFLTTYVGVEVVPRMLFSTRDKKVFSKIVRKQGRDGRHTRIHLPYIITCITYATVIDSLSGECNLHCLLLKLIIGINRLV